MRMFGAGEREHGEAVGERSQVLFQFVRRPAGRDEMNFVEIEAAVGGASHGEVAIVNRIEGAAEKRDTARVMLCGGAMRLRGGQYASQEETVIQYSHEFLIGAGSESEACAFSSISPEMDSVSREISWAGAEFCRARRRWNEPVRARLLRWPRRWSGIRGCALCRNLEELRAASCRWWHQAWWRRRSSVFRRATSLKACSSPLMT